MLKCVSINSVISDPSTYPTFMPIYLLLSYVLASPIAPLVSHKETAKIPGPMDDLRAWTVRLNTIYSK